MDYVVSSVKGTNTSLSDIKQYAGTLTVVTSKPEQNTEIMLVSTRVGSCVLKIPVGRASVYTIGRHIG